MKMNDFAQPALAETLPFAAWMGAVQARMDQALARLLPSPGVAPARLHEAMRYATLEGGKRFFEGQLAGGFRIARGGFARSLAHTRTLPEGCCPVKG